MIPYQRRVSRPIFLRFRRIVLYDGGVRMALCFFLFLLSNLSAFSDPSTKTNSLPSTNRSPSALKLIIGPSSTPAAGGTVHLTVGELNLIKGIFQGDYGIKVVPYAFKNENGKLSIEAPNDSLRKLTNQIAVDFVGKAVDTDDAVRRIDGTITPASHDKGTVLLWFMSGKRKMTFQTTYRLETR